jgi:hypothetical protein
MQNHPSAMAGWFSAGADGNPPGIVCYFPLLSQDDDGCCAGTIAIVPHRAIHLVRSLC